ncbi:MAG TPA: ATP-binding protein [Anaeromyxobacteraceae bacterium]|nr:ATP-binding protein [Anaeromyxobacteraceae bacterium]
MLARRLACTSSDLAREIAAGLEAIGRRVGADRVLLLAVCPGGASLELLEQWSRLGAPYPVAELAADDHPWLLAQVAAARSTSFRAPSAIPGDAARERRFHVRYGPRSAAVVPIVTRGEPAAVLLVGMDRRERAWGRPTLGWLDRAASVLASALARKRAHDARVEAEARLRGVLEGAPDGLLLVRPGGRIELANGRAAEIFGRSAPELAAQRLQDVLAPEPDAPARPDARSIAALLAAGAPLRARAMRPDGSATPVEVTRRELRTPSGALVCCAVHDPGDMLAAREETARLRAELAFLGRTALVGEMGAGIAHELKQPLTAILGNAEAAQRLLARGGAVDLGELSETLADVVKETRRAADVIGRMRDLLRRRDVERVPVDLAALLQGVAGHFHEQAVALGVDLSVECAPRLPRVLGDPVQLEQVAMNLVMNALDAVAGRRDGPCAIAIRGRPAGPEGVDVSVRDTGPGLGDEALSHAFDPFFTTKPSGMGMGLAICRSIVEAHGGRLLARNNADAGATFEFYLPAAAPGAAGVPRRKPA